MYKIYRLSYSFPFNNVGGWKRNLFATYIALNYSNGLATTSTSTTSISSNNDPSKTSDSSLNFQDKEISTNGENEELKTRHILTTKKNPYTCRTQFREAKRIVVKIGSAVITRDHECGVALGPLASIVEQVAEMCKEGREVLIVTSGAVAFGKQRIKQELNSFKNLCDVYNRTSSAFNLNLSLHPSAIPSSNGEKSSVNVKDGDATISRHDENLRISPTTNSPAITQEIFNQIDSRAFAALGQSGLMALYDAMFSQYGIKTAQVLLTQPDFNNKHCRDNLRSTIRELLTLKICPIINANDAIAPPPQLDSDLFGVISVKDNDIVATHLSVDFDADLLILMSDVEGIYSSPPAFSGNRITNGAKLLQTFCPSVHGLQVELGQKSRVGTGGMESKIEAATYALNNGCSVVICNGTERGAIQNIMKGQTVGTFFVPTATAEEFTTGARKPVNSSNSVDTVQTQNVTIQESAIKVRNGSRRLQQLTNDVRSEMIAKVADALLANRNVILEENQKDLRMATANKIAQPLLDRLKLTASKLENLAVGIKSIARDDRSGPGRVLDQTLLAEGMTLSKVTVPIGVLLIIFESRPDSLPQIAALSLATCNGLLLKGGKEAKNSNKCLYRIIRETLEPYGCQDAISLVNTRDDIDALLKLKDEIDLIIPRGSKELVTMVRNKSQGIPVLGHSEGICHVYLDKDAELEMSLKIVKDSKCNYPSACNAMETLLVHKALMKEGFFDIIYRMLVNENVIMHFGPKIMEYMKYVDFKMPVLKGYNGDFRERSTTTTLFTEYGDLECSIEMVDDLDEAISHIHTYGSSHTDTIVTDNDVTANAFLAQVDSACVFYNASTRFADGYRFGLGAEVGISTSRIHARGPVGMEGLLTTKWILAGNGNAVADFEPYTKDDNSTTLKYLHKKFNI